MDVRSQISMVFHLDKCIGCHTCSVACKNQWTDRRGVEYAWWNNVETKPGTGYPVAWEDQEHHRGGWRKDGDGLALRQGGKLATLGRLFSNPRLPVLDDYYHPFTYRYGELFDAPAGDDQPTARPISVLDGKPLEIRSGPNWDDDLSGSNVYAAQDPNLAKVSAQEREELQSLERMVFFYLPRICNHCVNPSCVAACRPPTSNTATALMFALATKSVFSSGDSARLFGVEPGGEPGLSPKAVASLAPSARAARIVFVPDASAVYASDGSRDVRRLALAPGAQSGAAAETTLVAGAIPTGASFCSMVTSAGD